MEVVPIDLTFHIISNLCDGVHGTVLSLPHFYPIQQRRVEGGTFLRYPEDGRPRPTGASWWVARS